MSATLPPLAGYLSRLIPADDRDAVIGDLLEDASWRDLRGGQLTLWLCGSCGTIAAGLAADRLRSRLSFAPARELVAGITADGGRALRHFGDTPGDIVRRVALFAGTVALLAASVEILVAALMTAAGLQH
jgi:hypothetical protein